jgi:hypothetical protein
VQRPCRGGISGGLCVVNVKLTMRLAIGAGLLGSAHRNARSLYSSGARGCYTGGVKQFGRRAGRGGDVARFPWRARSTSTEGGLSQSPPVSGLKSKKPCEMGISRIPLPNVFHHSPPVFQNSSLTVPDGLSRHPRMPLDDSETAAGAFLLCSGG